MANLINAIMFPIMILNLLGGLVGGTWLLFRGEWRLVLFGFIAVIVLNFIVSLILMIRVPFQLMAVWLLGRKNQLGYLPLFIHASITYAVMIGTCILAFTVCSNVHQQQVDFQAVPYLLWAWGLGLGYWQYAYSQGDNGLVDTIALFSTSVFYLLLLVAHFLSPLIGAIIFLLWILVGLLILPVVQLVIARKVSVANAEE